LGDAAVACGARLEDIGNPPLPAVEEKRKEHRFS
jgi:hypothetical protein